MSLKEFRLFSLHLDVFFSENACWAIQGSELCYLLCFESVIPAHSYFKITVQVSSHEIGGDGLHVI